MTDNNDSILRHLVYGFDMFGQPFYFRMRYGYSKHRSLLGSFLSVVLAITCFTYGWSKFKIMLNYGDSKILMWNFDYFLSSDFILEKSEYNLNFAFALLPNDVDDEN